jgi:DsbC/DsbD-like thiol-disulfide interchange protein
MVMLRLFFLLALLVAPVAALATTKADVLAARILPGWQTADGTRMVALELTLAPDWKTYWRSPGDAGIPPLFDWTGSENLASVQAHWPRPQVFHLNGMQSIGYREKLVLPLELTPKDAGKPVLLQVTVDLGVCRDICMPAAVTLSAEIAGKGGPDPAIRAALNSRPERGAEAGLTAISCTVEPISDGVRLTATLRLPSTGGAETVVFEPGGSAIWVSDATVDRKGGKIVASSDLVSETGAPFALDRSRVTVTVLGRDRAVEIAGCPAP